MNRLKKTIQMNGQKGGCKWEVIYERKKACPDGQANANITPVKIQQFHCDSRTSRIKYYINQ